MHTSTCFDEMSREPTKQLFNCWAGHGRLFSEVKNYFSTALGFCKTTLPRQPLGPQAPREIRETRQDGDGCSQNRPHNIRKSHQYGGQVITPRKAHLPAKSANYNNTVAKGAPPGRHISLQNRQITAVRWPSEQPFGRPVSR